LLGPNGAGKSTLIKVVMGLTPMTSGRGTVLGHPLGRGGRRIRDRVGFMPEDDCYIPALTGIEVLQFAAALSGLPMIEGLRRSHEILDFCGMKQERYRTIETYSTGMRQKIKFAAALVHDPDLLILDEPTSGLDPEERENLLHRIRILADESQKSVLISTHILPDVQMICDHAIIIARGRKVLSESLRTLNRPVSPTITLRTAETSDQFVAALRHRGLEVNETVESRWQVSGDKGDLNHSIWDAAARTGTTILSMELAKNDLETVFVRAVRESENARP
jgi:ABC-2 type transport system ATP-binding protein